MNIVVKAVKNLQHVEDGSILMDVLFEHIGEFIQFNACKDDSVDHGKRLYEDAMNGVFGAIAPADIELSRRKSEFIVKLSVKNALDSFKTELSALRDADELGIISESEVARYKELRIYNIEANRFLNATDPKIDPPKPPSSK